MALEYRFETLELVRGEEGVTELWLNRPEKLNSVNGLMHRELAEAFFVLARDEQTRIVVLGGRGRAFCAGGDVQWKGLDQPANYAEIIRDGVQILQSMLDLHQPIVTRLQGPVIGLGATIALHSDVIIADESAYLSDPHVPNVGVAAGDGGSSIWPFMIGHVRAKQLLFTGDRIGAAEAYAMGLFTEVCSEAELDDRVAAWVQRLSSLPGLAVSFTKQSINQWLRLGLVTVVQGSLALEGLTQASEDHAEAAAAFKEGRQPRFTGR